MSEALDLTSSRLSCVIFDMDGTLTQTNELIFASFNHVMEKFGGRRMTPREIVGLFGPPEEGGLEKVLGPERVAPAMEELCEFYRSRHRLMACLHAGIKGVLDFLQSKNVRMAVFTGKGRRTAAITLEEFGLARYFDLVVSGNDVVNHKPHPEGIHRIIQELSVPPGEALMVGDSLSDIKASRSAGVKIASVLWDSYDKERVLAAESDYVFHSVDELSDWFRQHLN